MYASLNIAAAGPAADQAAFVAALDQAHARSFHSYFTQYILTDDNVGYIAIDEDGSTVYGVDFSHAGETPGLGAEIVNPTFRKQFEGKELIKDGEFKSIAVVKAGQTIEGQDYVDGISGGTITSKGVHAMLLNSIGEYKNFLLKLNAAHKNESEEQ